MENRARPDDDRIVTPPPAPLPHAAPEDHADDRDDDDGRPARQRPENRTMAVWSHLGGLLGWFLVPMIFYLIEKNKRSFVAWHAREALNFQISMTIYYLLAAPVMCLFFLDIWYLFGGLALQGLIMLGELVLVIIASITASRGQHYCYPLTIPFVRMPADEANPFVEHD